MRIFPKATVHAKKITLAGTLILQMIFHEKYCMPPAYSTHKGFYLEKPASCWNPANPVFFIPSYLLEYMRLRKNISISFSQSSTAIINIISSEGCRIPVYIIHYSSLLKLSNLYKPGNASLRTPSLHHHLYHTSTTTNLKPYEPGKYLPHPLLTCF